MISSVEKKYDKFGFCAYKMVKDGVEIFVPLDESNTDYQEIQQWIADGGTVIDNGGGE